MTVLRRAHLNQRRHYGRRLRLAAAIKFLARIIKRGSTAAPTSPAWQPQHIPRSFTTPLPKRDAPPTPATPGRRAARAAFGSPSLPRAAASPCGGWAGPAPGPALPELPSPPRAGACSPVTIARSATASPVAIRSAVTAHQAPEGRRCCARSGDVLKPAVLRHSPRARVPPWLATGVYGSDRRLSPGRRTNGRGRFSREGETAERGSSWHPTSVSRSATARAA